MSCGRVDSPPPQGRAEVDHPRERDRGGSPPGDERRARFAAGCNAPPAAREFQGAEGRQHHDLMADLNAGAESQEHRVFRGVPAALHRSGDECRGAAVDRCRDVRGTRHDQRRALRSLRRGGSPSACLPHGAAAIQSLRRLGAFGGGSLGAHRAEAGLTGRNRKRSAFGISR